MGSVTPPPPEKGYDENGNLLPAILCLHGGGSNATVFKIQTRRLQWALGKQFRFVFPRGNFEGTPGMGMLPVFASCAPFYHWVTQRYKKGQTIERTDEEGVRILDEILFKTMEENGGAHTFVGVMGFSQGARLAIGLVLRQLLEEKRQPGSSPTNFKFGCEVGGPFPPISVTGPDVEIDYDLLREIPTVHGWGRDDPVKEGTKIMADYCDSPNTFVMDFEGGHHLPLKDDEARHLCDLILEAWHASGGKM